MPKSLVLCTDTSAEVGVLSEFHVLFHRQLRHVDLASTTSLGRSGSAANTLRHVGLKQVREATVRIILHQLDDSLWSLLCLRDLASLCVSRLPIDLSDLATGLDASGVDFVYDCGLGAELVDEVVAIEAIELHCGVCDLAMRCGSLKEILVEVSLFRRTTQLVLKTCLSLEPFVFDLLLFRTHLLLDIF